MARGFIPAGLRSSPDTVTRDVHDTPRFQVLGPLRSPTGRCDVSLNPLATQVHSYKGRYQRFAVLLTAALLS